MGDALISETFQDGHYISQFKHKGSVLEVVCGLSEEDFEVLLGLAGAAFRSMKDSANALSYAEALEKEVKKAVDAVQAKANSAACTLEGDLKTEIRVKEAEYKRNLQAKATEVDEIRSELVVAKASAQAAEAGLQAVKGQLGDAEKLAWEKYLTIISQKEADHKEEIKQRLAQADAQHAVSFKEVKEVYMKEAERLRKENDKALVSSEKGKTGEKEFDELCAEHTTWGPLENTSKETAAADRRATIRGCVVMFELKNYTDNVSTEQVNKFKRDMSQHKEAGLGVFISLHTNIANMGKRYIHIDWSVDSQMLVYVNAFYTHPIADTLAFIDTCIDTAKKIHGAVRSEDSSLQSRIGIAKELVQRELGRVTGIISSLKQNNTAVVDLLTKQYLTMDLEMKSTKESLKAMVDALVGKVADVEETSSLETVTPKEPKKRAKKIDAKAS